MKTITKFFLAISIAFIGYALIGYISRFIIHSYLLPHNLLDLSYAEIFSSIYIVIAGSIISLLQFRNNAVLKIDIGLWMVLLYWLISAIPMAYYYSELTTTSYGVSYINSAVHNIWSGKSSFYTHQLLEISYCVFCNITAWKIGSFALPANYAE
jgi:hypothetical protein